MAEELGDAISAVRVRQRVDRRHTPFDTDFVLDERPTEMACEEVQKFMWLDCGGDEIRAGNHGDAAAAQPLLA